MGSINKSAASNGYSNHNRALTMFADETTGNYGMWPGLSSTRSWQKDLMNSKRNTILSLELSSTQSGS